VSYGGNAPAVAALLGGSVDVMWTDIAAKAHVDSGKMIALGVASPVRWNLFPNVPTLEEAGLPGLYLQSWSGLAGPADLPPNLASALNVAFGKVLNDPRFALGSPRNRRQPCARPSRDACSTRRTARSRTRKASCSYEVYQDQAAMDFHMSASHLAAYRKKRQDLGLVEGPPDIQVLRS
jgi:hypothetical protein